MRARPGRPYPLGATWNGLGVNFAVYAEHAEAVSLLLFEHEGDPAPSEEIAFDDSTGPVWHGYVAASAPASSTPIASTVPTTPDDGHRFNRNKVLLDPYAKAIGRPLRWHD